MAAQNGYHILDTDYADSVRIRMITEDADKLNAKVTDITSGKARAGDPQRVVYAVMDGNVQIMT